MSCMASHMLWPPKFGLAAGSAAGAAEADAAADFDARYEAISAAVGMRPYVALNCFSAADSSAGNEEKSVTAEAVVEAACGAEAELPAWPAVPLAAEAPGVIPEIGFGWFHDPTPHALS